MDVTKYKSVGEWYRDHRGRVPVQMAAALERLIRDEGLTFLQAYAKLKAGGQIVEIEP